MRVINWLALAPQETEIKRLRQVSKPLSERKLRQLLVEAILRQFPWSQRSDLISFYHPQQAYHLDEWVALPKIDPQNLRPLAWHVAQVTGLEEISNPSQGDFQMLTLTIGVQTRQVAAAIPGATFYTPTLNAYSDEDLVWLSNWVEKNFTNALQQVIKDLIASEKLTGELMSGAFLPRAYTAFTPATLKPFLEDLSLTSCPWATEDAILEALDERGGMPDMDDWALHSLLREGLKKSGGHNLGAGRWTTKAIYQEMNREILRGLPVPRVRSRINKLWTEKDRKDLKDLVNKKLPKEARQIIQKMEGTSTPIKPPDDWHPLTHPVRLPTLSYLHLTQGYFPIGELMDVFEPGISLVMAQIVEGEPLPFLVDRHRGTLKALEIENMRRSFLDVPESIPAGTHLWLEYQGGDCYRIAPHPLDEPEMVQCKIAYMENGCLRIEQSEICMRYEGDPQVFKAEMRFEDIEALFEEARQTNLSVQDAMIETVQELCALEPQKGAHREDIFNAVFLKRMCSPRSVMVLLYTRPFFIRLGNGRFRYADSPEQVPPKAPRERRTRKSRPTASPEKSPDTTRDIPPPLEPVREPVISHTGLDSGLPPGPTQPAEGSTESPVQIIVETESQEIKLDEPEPTQAADEPNVEGEEAQPPEEEMETLPETPSLLSPEADRKDEISELVDVRAEEIIEQESPAVAETEQVAGTPSQREQDEKSTRPARFWQRIRRTLSGWWKFLRRKK